MFGLLASFSSVRAYASPSNDTYGWKRIDHAGVVSAAPDDMLKLPPWSGWLERAETDRGGYIRRLRVKNTHDKSGSALRFSFRDVEFGPHCDDRFPVTGPKGSGFVNRSGKIVIAPKYGWVEQFYNGLVPVREKLGTAWLLLDKNGVIKYTLPLDMEPLISAQFWGVDKGFLPVQKGDIDDQSFGGKGSDTVSVNGLYALDEKRLYPLGHSAGISAFSEGLSRFSGSDPTLSGYVDEHGKIVIPKQFQEAGDFKDGLAAVRLGTQRGYIDHTGSFF